MKKILSFLISNKKNILALVLPVSIVLSFINPFCGFLVLFCMIGAIGVSFFKGRFWCSSVCPRGSFLDSQLDKISLNKKIPKLFKNGLLRIVLLIFMMSIIGFKVYSSHGNIASIGTAFGIMLLITTVLGILLGLIYNSRIWCMICPMGNVGGFISKKSSSLKIDSTKCVSCNLCKKNCPMEIDPSSYKDKGAVETSKCIKCNICVTKCPKDALSL